MSSLKKEVIGGVIWTGLGTLGSGVIGFLVTVVLARYLTPSDFGAIEIIMSVVLLSEMLLDCGFSQAIIREKHITQSDLSSIFILNLIIALIIYVIIFFSSSFISSYYAGNEHFELMLKIMAIKVIIDSMSMCQIANLTRLMNFKLVAKITVVSMFVSGIVSIISIYNDLGIWSIVIYNLLISFLKTFLISINVKWIPSFSLDFIRIKYFLSFGFSLMSYKLIDRFVSTFESMSVGKVYSSSSLGLFSQARKFNALVVETLLGIIQKVTYPALSKISEQNKLKNGYKDVIKIAMFIISPISIFMLLNPEQFMVVVFGSQWISSASYLIVFAIWGLIFPAYSICVNVFLVKGKTKQMFILGLLKQIMRIITILVMLNYDLLSFTLATVGVMIISAIIDITCSGRLIGYSIISLLKDNLKTLSFGLLAVFSSKCLLMNWELYNNVLYSIVLNFIIVVLLYLLTSYYFKNTSCRLLYNVIKELPGISSLLTK